MTSLSYSKWEAPNQKPNSYLGSKIIFYNFLGLAPHCTKPLNSLRYQGFEDFRDSLTRLNGR